MNDFDQIIANEVALQRPELRGDPGAVQAFLTPDFVEVDSSGWLWNAPDVAAAMAAQKGYVQPEFSDAKVTRLAPDVCLLTYRDKTRRHSSMWTRTDTGGWLLRYHQQTLISG